MTAEHDAAHLEAADWLARLREPDISLEDTLAWQSWMNQDARNAAAFDRMEEVSRLLHTMPRPARSPAWDTVLDRYDASVPLGNWRRSRQSTRIAAIAASALLMLGAVTWMTSGRDALPWRAAANEELQTRVGENREERLADGSRIILGGDTRLRVALDTTARRIELLRGEAYFAVAKDRKRPFSVRAGSATVEALGTEFNVRRGRDRVVVAVVEGRVAVSPRTRILPAVLLREFKPQFVTVALDAGQQSTADGSGIGAAVPFLDPSAATAWQEGRLAFRLEPLRYVLEDLNRYVPKRIEFEDERIGSLLVTGTIVGSNVHGWIGSLHSALGIEAVETPDRILLKTAAR